MRAIAANGEELARIDVRVPRLRRGQVLVKVHAAALNPVDKRLRASPLKYLDAFGLPRVPGSDFAGEVVAIGSGTGAVALGDRVYGMNPALRGGAFAEYVAVSWHHMAPLPATLDAAQAASVPLAALTALQGMRDLARLPRPGAKVLVNGATGGVGVFAVQIACILGAEVHAVCSAGNAELARELGAREVIDYREEDWVDRGPTWDVVFDAAGHRRFTDARRALLPGGHFISTELSPADYLDVARSRFSSRARAHVVHVVSDRTDLQQLTAYLEAGELRTHVHRTWDLAEVPEALRALKAGGHRGKHVILVAGDSSSGPE
jgi:NADPH:quinone reductase-like Zn-dependent oxidoreductase